MGLLEALAVFNSDQAVLKLVALSDVIVDVAGGDDFSAGFSRQFQQGDVACRIAEGEVLLQFDILVIRPEPVEVPFYQAFGLDQAGFGYQL